MSKYLSQDFLDDVISKNDIVNTISKYVTLTRRGNNYWACCPFHMEKTPSMSIKEDGQFYKCFGCGEGGNVINFVMKIENVDFYQAVEILCKNAGLKMPTLEDATVVEQKKKQRDTYLNILNDTCKFYQNNLNLNIAKPYWDYIDKRGLNKAMIEKFKIGVSLDFKSLPKYLKSKGYKDEDMIESGVLGKNEDNKSLYDFYGQRLVFPIVNGLNEVVGFSGRDISNNPEKAKYKNTFQTMLFNKSNLIYGFNFLRELKRQHELDSIILVEGQMDVIACHQAGITNAVGCLGTALTPNHAKDLSHLSNNIILCLDGDSAGANATYKAMTILREANMNVSVVRLTGAKDPDEYIKKFGKDSFVDRLANATNYMEFILIDLANKYDLKKTNEKNDYINEALAYLSNLSTATEQEIYLSVLREIVNVPIDALRKTLSGAKDDAKSKKIINEQEDLRSNAFIDNAKELILATLLYNKVAKKDDYNDIFTKNDEYQEIYNYIIEQTKNGQAINISSLYTIFDITNNSIWDRVINYNFPNDDVFNRFFNDSVTRLRIAELKLRKETLNQQLKQNKDMNEMINIMAKIKEIDGLINKLSSLKS